MLPDAMVQSADLGTGPGWRTDVEVQSFSVNVMVYGL